MHGLGHRLAVAEDLADDFRTRHISELLGVSSPSRSELDLRYLDPVVLDQARTNTCVPHSGSESLYSRGQYAKEKGDGDAIPRPSILQGYVYGQLEDQRIDGIDVGKRKVLDVGMRARSMLLAWSRYGVVSEERWAFDPAELAALVAAPTIEEASKRIPFDVDVAGADAKLQGWHPIGQATSSAEIALALDQGHFPIKAFRLYQNFMDYKGGDYVAAKGNLVGQHMMMAAAFRPGFTCFKNHWSKQWGDAGYIWIANSYVDGPDALDGYVPTIAPNLH